MYTTRTFHLFKCIVCSSSSMSQTSLANDAFGRQAASYFKGQQYQVRGEDMVRPPSDAMLRSFAMKAYDKSPKSNVAGYSYVPELSTTETQVYVNPLSKQAIVSFRGSKTAHDWLKTDRQIAFGNIRDSSRYRRSYNQLDSALGTLHGYKVYTTGHSLGGSIGEALSHDLRHEGHTSFNPGYGVRDVVPVSLRAKSNSASTFRSYRNSSDYISMLGASRATDINYRGGYLVSAHSRKPTRYQRTGLN